MKKSLFLLLTLFISLVIVWWLFAFPSEFVLSNLQEKAESNFKKASELLKRGDYEAAIVEYKQVIKLNPKSKIAQDAQYWIGQTYFRSGQYDLALEIFKEIIEEYPESEITQATKQMLEKVQMEKKEASALPAQLASRITYTWEDGKWVNQSKYIATFDNKGLRWEGLSQQWKNNKWEDSYKEITTKNDKGKDTLTMVQYLVDGSWTISMKNTMIYNDQGHKIEELYQNWKDGSWINDIKDIYTSNENGYITEAIVKKWINDTWVNDRKAILKVDEKGNWLERINQKWENDAWIESNKADRGRGKKYKYSYSVGENGNEIEIRTKKDNGSFVNDQKRIFKKMDENKTEILIQKWKDGSWINSQKWVEISKKFYLN